MTVETLTPPTPGDEVPTRRRPRLRTITVVLLLLVAGFAGRTWWNHVTSDVRHGTQVVDVDGMAAEYGIHLDLLAVTAAGGLVELRYQVVDPDKAQPLVHDPDLSPALVNEMTGQTIVMSAPPHHHGTDLQLGRTYFFLMANAGNALRPGDTVTVVIGDVRIEHVVAEG